jgi:pimeloyl-ACP methyl ester carboxylesterase
MSEEAAGGAVRRLSARGLVHEVRGTGPAILFVHGWCLNRRLWLYQDQELQGSHTTISVDLAGFGDSSGLAGPYTVERHASDLAALISELGIADVTVVGFAYGAMVGMELAARSPEALSGLVAIGVPSAATAPYERMPRAMKRDWPEFAARSARSICASNVSEATLSWLTRMFEATPLTVALAAVAQLAEWEPWPLMGRVTVPTLVVSGSDDSIVPPEIAQRLAAGLSRGSLEIVEGAGHLVPIDGREQLSGLIAELTSRQPSS